MNMIYVILVLSYPSEAFWSSFQLLTLFYPKNDSVTLT